MLGLRWHVSYVQLPGHIPVTPSSSRVIPSKMVPLKPSPGPLSIHPLNTLILSRLRLPLLLPTRTEAVHVYHWFPNQTWMPTKIFSHPPTPSTPPVQARSLLVAGTPRSVHPLPSPFYSLVGKEPMGAETCSAMTNSALTDLGNMVAHILPPSLPRQQTNAVVTPTSHPPLPTHPDCRSRSQRCTLFPRYRVNGRSKAFLITAS